MPPSGSMIIQSSARNRPIASASFWIIAWPNSCSSLSNSSSTSCSRFDPVKAALLYSIPGLRRRLPRDQRRKGELVARHHEKEGIGGSPATRRQGRSYRAGGRSQNALFPRVAARQQELPGARDANRIRTPTREYWVCASNYWPYGVEPRRRTLRASLQHPKQGLCHQMLEPDELLASQVQRRVRSDSGPMGPPR